MTQEHPITPPPELVQQWASKFYETTTAPGDWAIATATQAARWGADQELEACVEWMGNSPVIWRGDPEEHPGFYLREARRPKPLSHKELALIALTALEACAAQSSDTTESVFYIRRALEALHD